MGKTKNKENELTTELKKQLIVGGSKKLIVEHVFKVLKRKGITHNSRGYLIKEENILRLLNCMLNDIKRERRGWWRNFKIEDNDHEVKIIEIPNYNLKRNKFKNLKIEKVTQKNTIKQFAINYF